MRQRGRKSSASVTAAPAVVRASTSWATPPEALDSAAQAVWRRLVAAMPSGWFKAEHLDMLTAYCRHVAAADRFGQLRDEADINPADGDSVMNANRLSTMAERETRAALALARSMRITHQATVEPKTAGRRLANSGRSTIDWSATS